MRILSLELMKLKNKRETKMRVSGNFAKFAMSGSVNLNNCLFPKTYFCCVEYDG